MIKFPFLWSTANKLKANFIATGHYACIVKTKSGFQLFQAKDKTKDQSYFLHKLSQSDLSHTLFPLSDLTKLEVRKIAKKSGLHNWNKKGTKGICFVGKVDMFSFLKKKIKPKKGKILTHEGEPIGYHPGIMYYTIGQRIGPRLGIKIEKHLGEKWYIAEKKKNNTLIVAPKSLQPKKQKIFIKSFHQINPNDKIPKQLKARIRHLGKPLPGKLSKQKSKYIFTLSKPEKEVAEGQSIVLYYKNRVIGGGEIRLK